MLQHIKGTDDIKHALLKWELLTGGTNQIGNPSGFAENEGIIIIVQPNCVPRICPSA